MTTPALTALIETAAKLKELEAKATPAPWEHVSKSDPRGQPSPFYRALICLISTDPPEAVVAKIADTVEVEEWPANAALLAESRNALPAFLALPALLAEAMTALGNAGCDCFVCDEPPDRLHKAEHHRECKTRDDKRTIAALASITAKLEEMK